jgi:hypothetical protein
MAITTVNSFYQGTSSGANSSTSSYSSPTVSSEIMSSVASGFASQELTGFCVPILDGAATTFTLNWIDGTFVLPYVPSFVFTARTDPPAWQASTIYPLGAIVLGLGHVQQVSAVSPGTQGFTAAVAPTFSTVGGTVIDGHLTWKDLGAIAATTVFPQAVTAITTTSALITLNAAGAASAVPVINFRISR